MSQSDDQQPFTDDLRENLRDFVLADPLQGSLSTRSRESAPPRNEFPLDVPPENQSESPNQGLEVVFPDFGDPFGAHGVFTQPHDLSMHQVWIPERTKGFKNEGNSCYLNSALQCLIHSPPFTSIFLHHHGAHRLTPGVQNLNLDCTFCLLEILTRKVLESTENFRGLRDYTCRIYEKTPQVFEVQNFDIAQQQDGSEFLSKLLLVLATVEQEKACGQYNRRVLRDLLDTSIFQTCSYMVTEKTTCTRCMRTSGQPEPGFILTLSATRGNTLEEVLNAEAEEQMIEGFFCEGRCLDVGTATRKWSMKRAPNVLLIQLQRTGFSSTGRGTDDLFTCKYGLSLDISTILEGAQNPESESGAEYELVGVMVFLPRRRPEDRRYKWDDFNGGHYISYVRSSDNKWTRKNDERHARVDVTEVLEQNAFLLFYVRQDSYRSLLVPPPLESQQPSIEPEQMPQLETLSLYDDQQPSFTPRWPLPQVPPIVMPMAENAQIFLTPQQHLQAAEQRFAHPSQVRERTAEPSSVTGLDRRVSGVRSARFYRVEIPVIFGRKFFDGDTQVDETIYTTELLAVVELIIPDPKPDGERPSTRNNSSRNGRGILRTNQVSAEVRESGGNSNLAGVGGDGNNGGNANTRGQNSDRENGNDSANNDNEEEHPSLSIKIREKRHSQDGDIGNSGNSNGSGNDNSKKHPSFSVRLRGTRDPSQSGGSRQQS